MDPVDEDLDGLSRLYIEPATLVAYGRVDDSKREVHCRPVTPRWLLSILSPEALLPVPIPDEAETVAQGYQ